MTKKMYITTAIPYVNGTPHIGNAIDYLLADIWARYQRQNGNEVRYQAGTDEHGNKIAAKAKELNIDPKTYTDQMYGNFEQLMKKIGTTHTDFIRTTDAHHIGAAQYIWQQLAPHIYKKSYQGWYCNGCESFATDADAANNNGICPDHQTPYQHISEENYFLRCSDFTEKIREAIETEKMKIVPEFRKKEFLELIKDGVQDVSISRPVKTLSWGIPVPGDPDQIMYVWLDALANYITVLGYPDKEGWQDFWPADVQVIGKDILRFHAGIWPAMLLGLGLSLPKTLLVHGFVNVAGAKMSKTVGNVVDPNQIIDEYGVDAWRYYFARHIPTFDDGDFTWEKFEKSYNGELANDLGNLAQRLAGMIQKYQAGVIGDAPQGEHDVAPYREAMEQFNYNRAFDEIWSMIRSLNQYIDTTKPWVIAKDREKNSDAESHLNEVLAQCVGSLLQISDLLAPFLPETAQKIQSLFETGVVPQELTPIFPRLYLHTTDPNSKKTV